MVSERTSHLILMFSQPVWEEEGERERKEEDFRERESTVSLFFLAIGPSNPGNARGKVDPLYKGYAWVLALWSFSNSER